LVNEKQQDILLPSLNYFTDILNYRVELDVTNRFLSPIHTTTIPCSTVNKHTVYEIRTEGAANDPIVSGYYTLAIIRNRISFTITEPEIAELGLSHQIISDELLYLPSHPSRD